MSERSLERWEAHVQATAGAFLYPPTPDIASAVREHLAEKPRRRLPVRRLAWAAVALVIVVASLLAVPQVRAGLLDVLRIGAVRILLTEPTATATATPAPSLLTATADTSRTLAPTATSPATPTPLTSVLDLAGETTLAEAQAQVGFPIRLPAYPPDLRAPDRVFLQDLEGPALILVWLDPEEPEQVRLTLHELGPGAFVSKGPPTIVEETTVHGQRAVWTTGPYFVKSRGGSYDNKRLIEGHVLIWTEGEMTYRLETDLALEEAIRIAESLND
jgi:hypothetical protein